MYHVSGLEKALYLTAHEYKALSGTYHTASVWDTSGSYNGTMMQRTAKQFCEVWLNDTKDENTTGEAPSEYAANLNNANEITALFNSMSHDIRYLVDSGTLTDVIPDDFDLVLPADGSAPFSLMIGDQTVNGTVQAGGPWHFGNKVDLDGDNTPETYPYTITYFPPNGGEQAKFVMDVRVPVENNRPVTLSYDLRIKEGSERKDYDTNVSAVLAYQFTNQSTGTYTFDVPQVDYNYALVTYDANGGTGTQTDAKNPYCLGKSVTVLGPRENEGTIQREGYIFKGWNTKRDGQGTAYQPAETFTITADTVLYAMWELASTPTPEPKYPFTFTKVWQGEVNEAAQFTLYKKDGTVYKTYTGKDMTKKENTWTKTVYLREPADYYVQEGKLMGYQIKYENGDASVTDRCLNGGTILNAQIPHTGDSASITLYIALAGLCLAALATFRRREGKRREI